MQMSMGKRIFVSTILNRINTEQVVMRKFNDNRMFCVIAPLTQINLPNQMLKKLHRKLILSIWIMMRKNS